VKSFNPAPPALKGRPSSAAPILDIKYKLLSEDLRKLLKERTDEFNQLEKIVDVMNQKFVIQQNQIKELREREETEIKRQQTLAEAQQNTLVTSHDDIEKKLADAIIADLADRVGKAVIDHVAQEVMDNFKFIPAARNMTIRFVAKEMLWADYTSLQAEIIEAWQSHVAEHLKCSVEDIDEHLKISMEVPKLTVSSKREKSKKLRHLDLDTRDEVG